MGIDFGTKRVGIALSDEAGLMGFPHVVIENDRTLLEKVLEIIQEHQVKEIVVGHSRTLGGADNPVHRHTQNFIADLEKAVSTKIQLEPEYFSTQEAIRDQGRNDLTDASAAAVILNSYLLKK